MTETRVNLMGMPLPKLQAFFVELGEKPFRAQQISKWIHHAGVTDFEQMTNLGKNLRVRADTFGYLQRSFAGCVSRVDQQEAREAGRYAARCAMSGDIDGSIAIQRINNHPYKIDYKRIELSDVAGKTQTLDPRYIVDGRDIDSSFRDYALPLVGQLPAIELLRAR